MFWRFLSLACCLCTAKLVLADSKPPSSSPTHVTVCQLENQPENYDHKLVEVSGRIYFGKFDFVIDGKCEPHGYARVWVDIGGDVVSPAQFWDIGNFLPKQRGVDVRVRGVTVPLVRDPLTEQFVSDVGAIRLQKPNGEGCGSECLFYEVTATVRGVFFSGVKGGFGMEQCCHLLVIERVTTLSSKRTTVPAGGTYTCATERWQPSPAELETLSTIPACSLRANFNGCLAIAAKHWGETIKPNGGLENPRGWISPDMTLYYGFSGGFVQKSGQTTEMTPSSSFTRQVCRATSPLYLASGHVSCGFYRSFLQEDKNAAIALQEKVDAGQETWSASDMAQVAWLAYDEQRKQWNLDAATEAKLSKCEPSPAGRDDQGKQQQWGYCTWLTPDDLQEITVQLHKPGYLDKHDGELKEVVWIAQTVEVNLCQAKPSPH
jgi:hypothetical protein